MNDLDNFSNRNITKLSGFVAARQANLIMMELSSAWRKWARSAKSDLDFLNRY
jgi:hypothetical protein